MVVLVVASISVFMQWASTSSPNSLPRHVLAEATAAVLNQHHCYNEHDLMQLLAENSLYIPVHHRWTLIICAATSAEHAVKLANMAEKHRAPGMDEKTAMAANADCLLTY